jgi:uncharacterized membrane protein
MRETQSNLDEIRRQALDRVDQAQRRFRYAVGAVAAVEGLLLLAVLILIDFSDRLQLLVFLCSILVYATVLVALFALGAYIVTVEARILRALELGG